LKRALKFVIHEHHARHHHWDLRLEKGGVLKSWAVPKGLSEETGVKRLAVEVEDHPLDYADFEGAIPEGQYGAGDVVVWDKGAYAVESWEKDKVTISLHGRRLTGRYAIIHISEKSWLVMKLTDKEL
jgi:DNA ligase D-like protein (predicted 3'-phosphoesterase)